MGAFETLTGGNENAWLNRLMAPQCCWALALPSQYRNWWSVDDEEHRASRTDVGTSLEPLAQIL
jgi:hypothetical protein